MKKILLTLTILASAVTFSSAQILPSFQFGVKGGLDVASIQNTASATFSSSNQSGYLAGIWARFGALGLNFQPEMYYTSKSVMISNPEGGQTNAKFTSLDFPLLFGAKIGAFGLGGRFYTGPLVSFAINKDQSFSGAIDKAVALNYQNQNFAWQFGAGLDIKRVSFDLRYEAGITKQDYGAGKTKINLFSLSIAYSLLKF